MAKKPVKQRRGPRTRPVKRRVGSNKTHPIKEEWQRLRFVDWFSKRRDRAKTEYKRGLYDRDYMIILTALYTGLRANDLLQLFVSDLNAGKLAIEENKTGKAQYFELPTVYYSEFLAYVKRHDLKPEDQLFRKGKNGQHSADEAQECVTPQRIDRVIKEAAQAVGIPHLVGLHGLRKTFGYMCRTQWGYSLADIRIFYNHANEATSEIYIEWDKEDTDKMRARMDLKKRYG